MTHAPGPWPKPEYDNHGNGGFSEWWDIASDEHGHIARAYTEANANLIAAAPALLEACEEMLEWFGDESEAEGAVKARAAIAQAKGESK